MLDKKSKISLCCEKCNESLEMTSEEIEIEVPKFSERHINCELKGFINGKFFASFSKKTQNKQSKWLN